MVIGHYTGLALHDYVKPSSNLYSRYTDLSGAYDVLRNRELDVVVPVGAYIDDNIYAAYSGVAASPINFGKQLADFCYNATTEQNSCIGVIGTRPVLSWAMRNAPKVGTGVAVVSGYFLGYSGDGLSSNADLNTELTSLFGALYMTGGNTVPVAAIRSGIAAVEFSTPSSKLLKEWHAYHAYFNDTAAFASDVDNFYNASYQAWLYGAADQDGNILSDIDEDAATSVNAGYFASWQAKNADGTSAVDSRNGKVDAGAYLSVFTAPVRAVGTQIQSRALAFGAAVSNTSRNTEGAPAYAGLVNSLAPQSSTTNKQVPGLTNLKPLSVSQVNDLVGMRHVTMLNRSTGFTVASGVTGAHNVSKYVRSDYVRLSTVRIVHAAVDLIRSVANKYIGEPNNAPRLNALDAEIDQVLLSVKITGGLNAYSFSISSTPDQRVLGELDINLTLVPAFEITTINLVVSLSKE